MADEEEADCCPLCMEELDITDKTFNACPCGYQVCLWCWHQIKNEYNALCPACRAPYAELSKQKSPLDREDVLRRTKQMKQKEKSERRTASQSRIPTLNRRNLANVRVMQRNLVYVIGLPQHFADDDLLRSNECFGQYGKIVKAVVNKAHLSSDRSNATASAYITFAHKEDALSCIIAVDGYYLDGALLRASFGTTKYCNFFLRSMTCNNPDCLYLHELGEQDDSFTKDEMQSALHSGKAAFRDLTANDVREGSRFPPPLKALSEGPRTHSGTHPQSTASAASSSATAASNASTDRQAQSAAAIYKLRQTNGSSSSSANSHSASYGCSHPPMRRGGSYSRIVTGFTGDSDSSSASSSSASSPSPSTPPPPPSSSSTSHKTEDAAHHFDDDDFPPPQKTDDRKPNLRVDTSVSAKSNSSTETNAVGPLEALKRATGSTSQEPAWAQPFPSPAVSLHHDNDDALSTGPTSLDPVFSPFGMGFDSAIRSSGGRATPRENDPWGGSSTSMSPLRDTRADGETLTSSFPSAASASSSSSSTGFPLGLNGNRSSSSGLSGLSFASIDAIFSQRNESSEALAGLLGVQLAPQPLPHGSASVSTTPSSIRSSRFAFANQPSHHNHHSHQSDLHDAPRGPPPMGLPPASPYRTLGRYSSFRESATPQSALFRSTADTNAFPPLGASGSHGPPPLPRSSSSPFLRSTSDPFPNAGFGGSTELESPSGSGLAFLQQMLPNVNISYGGEYATSSTAPTPAESSNSSHCSAAVDDWESLSTLSFDTPHGMTNGMGSGSGNNTPYYDPAIVAAPGLSGFYGLGDDERHLTSRLQ